MPQPSQNVTELLLAWSGGDQTALDRLVPLVSAELHRLAHRYLRHEPAGHTLQTTALVNEAYLRLIDASQVAWHDRAHFFAVSANLMRRILVDFARRRHYQKRGGGALTLRLVEDETPAPQPAVDVAALDEALQTLAAFDSRAARIVELRFFGGLTVEETASVMGVSSRTIKREWATAKVWLLGEMSGGAA
ncbi:MAG: polymerase sigma factor [Acidobacteria bacterium]|nr:polymerase sigma factor [Acidobacteriota bacterium]